MVGRCLNVEPIMKKTFDSRLFTLLDDLVVEHDIYRGALESIADTIDAAGRYQDRSLLPVIGPSRSGKSTLLKITLKRYQTAALKDEKPCGLRYIMLPKTRNTKAVLMKVQYALGYPLFYVGSEAEMQIRIVDLFKRQNITTLLLDELQHSVSVNGAVNFEIADLFKSILDEAGVQIIGCGLGEALAIMESNEQLMGRCMQAVELNRFDWNNADDRAEFVGVLEAFRGGLPGLRMPEFGDEEAGFRWYVASGGLIGYVHKIFRSALDQACKDNRSRVGWEDIATAHQAAVFYRGPQVRPFDRSFDVADIASGTAHAQRVGEREEESAAPKTLPGEAPWRRNSKKALRRSIRGGD